MKFILDFITGQCAKFGRCRSSFDELDRVDQKRARSPKFRRIGTAKEMKREWISLPAQTHSPSVSSPFLTVKFFPGSTTQSHVRSKWCWGSASNCKGNWAYPHARVSRARLLTQLSNFDEKTAKLLRTPHGSRRKQRRQRSPSGTPHDRVQVCTP